MSYYPYWAGWIIQIALMILSYNLNDMSCRYNKDVMVCEVGGLEVTKLLKLII